MCLGSVASNRAGLHQSFCMLACAPFLLTNIQEMVMFNSLLMSSCNRGGAEHGMQAAPLPLCVQRNIKYGRIRNTFHMCWVAGPCPSHFCRSSGSPGMSLTCRDDAAEQSAEASTRASTSQLEAFLDAAADPLRARRTSGSQASEMFSYTF